MASKKVEKGSQLGKVRSFLASSVGVLVTLKEDFFRKRPRYILRLPKGKPIGDVYWTVESSGDPVTFSKKKDAEEYKRLLLISTAAVKADIIRREITNEGFIATHGDENV